MPIRTSCQLFQNLRNIRFVLYNFKHALFDSFTKSNRKIFDFYLNTSSICTPLGITGPELALQVFAVTRCKSQPV